ncbi:hypothetical protein HDV02_002143 [Globomyces sp. JEL0801]|nr:hypothetical protein HDV02_002143 [Globomyces sp. JEL0801]
MLSANDSEQTAIDDDYVERYKLELDLETFKMISTLSPGVKLQSIMEHPEFDVSSDQRKSIFIKDLGKKSKDNPKKPQKVKKEDTTVKRRLEEKEKKWDFINDLLEEKRLAYHKELENIIKEHGKKSKLKILQFEKQMLLKKELELKKLKENNQPKPPRNPPNSTWIKIPEKWKDSKWYKIVSKDLPVDIQTANEDHHMDYIKDLPELSQSNTPGRMYLSTTRRKPLVSNEIVLPELRELSIDHPLEEDANNLWQRSSHHTQEKLIAKSKDIILMKQTVVKYKGLSSPFVQKLSEGCDTLTETINFSDTSVPSTISESDLESKHDMLDVPTPGVSLVNERKRLETGDLDKLTNIIYKSSRKPHQAKRESSLRTLKLNRTTTRRDSSGSLQDLLEDEQEGSVDYFDEPVVNKVVPDNTIVNSSNVATIKTPMTPKSPQPVPNIENATNTSKKLTVVTKLNLTKYKELQASAKPRNPIKIPVKPQLKALKILRRPMGPIESSERKKIPLKYDDVLNDNGIRIAVPKMPPLQEWINEVYV